MLTRLALGFLWLLHHLPARILSPMGQGLGLLFLALGRARREVTRTNLRLCFPEMNHAQREDILRRHYRAFGRAALECSIVWWGSESRVRQFVTLEGEENLRVLGDRPIMFLTPHFTGIEHQGLRVSMEVRGLAVYAKQKSPVFNTFLLQRRTRFSDTRMVSRQEGIKAILRGVREGRTLQLSPDMDLGPQDSIFVPFFGVPTATVTALPRIAKLTGAAIVPAVVTQLPHARGYRVRFYPPWTDYPTPDVEADVRRMNAFIEERIREMPEQYLWMHKRFKTRPPGDPSVYGRFHA